MSRRCDLTGKSPGRPQGEPLEHQDQAAVPAEPLNVTMISDALGRSVKLRVSANALKTVDHRGGLDAFLMKAKDDDLSPRALELKRQIQKKQAAAANRPRTNLHSSSVLSMAGLLPSHLYSSTSVNCSSSVRCSDEKLSSEISVSTSAPALAMHAGPPCCRSGGPCRRKITRAVDQRAGLDRAAAPADAHGAARPGEAALQHQELAAGVNAQSLTSNSSAALERERAGSAADQKALRLPAASSPRSEIAISVPASGDPFGAMPGIRCPCCGRPSCRVAPRPAGRARSRPSLA